MTKIDFSKYTCNKHHSIKTSDYSITYFYKAGKVIACVPSSDEFAYPSPENYSIKETVLDRAAYEHEHSCLKFNNKMKREMFKRDLFASCDVTLNAKAELLYEFIENTITEQLGLNPTDDAKTVEIFWNLFNAAAELIK